MSKVTGKRCFSTITFAYFASLLASCSSAPSIQPDAVVIWSESQLDQYAISVATDRNSTVRSLESISGRVLSMINLVAGEMAGDSEVECGENILRSHLFFFKDTEANVRIVAWPRFVPDSSVREGIYSTPEGERRYAVPAISGATRLPGCFAEYIVNPETKEIRKVSLQQ